MVTVYTDVDGKFSISLTGDMVTAHNLYFSYDGLERTVRTFHLLMGSTNYDVRLKAKEDYQYGNSTMGVMVPNWINFPSVKFYNRERLLSQDTKALLNVVANKLKDDPTIVIQLVAYGKSINDTKNATRKFKLIRNFLIEDMRIDKDRVLDKIEPAGSNDTIDIFQYSGQ